LGIKKILGIKFFGYKNFLGHNFLIIKFFGYKFFWVKNFLGIKFFSVKHFLGIKFFFGQTHTLFLGETFLGVGAYTCYIKSHDQIPEILTASLSSFIIV